MKIIDKTLLQDDKGNISFTARVQGTLKYGANWFAEMESQKAVVAQLDRALEKSFVLIRNFNLPQSDIVIPLILIGLGGINIIYVTNVKGTFEAKGDQWNAVDNSGNSQPAALNPLDRVAKYTRVFQKYLEINKISVAAPITPIVIAINPGAHIESTRPIAKVVKSDAIKPFINSLLQTPPILRNEQIYALAERIVEPRLPEEPEPAAPVEAPPSYVAADFDNAAPAKPFNANDLGFSFQEESVAAESQPQSAAPAAQTPRQRAKPASKKILGMSVMQFIALAGMVVFWLCIMAGAGAYIYFTQYSL